MTFMHPAYFLLLVPIILLVYFEMKKKSSAIRYSDLSFFKRTTRRGSVLRYVQPGMIIIALVFMTIALARPQKGRIYEEIETKGVDIILCLDISTSMRAEDFKPKNRLFVAKQKAKEFIEKRKGDRIGLVVFAADALTQCPLTFDHRILEHLLDYVDFGLLEDGTAIGMGLATAVARLKGSKAKEKMIILLTDGRNNAGELDPESAAKLGQAYNIKIYCIGVGTRGKVPYPVDHPIFGRQYVQAEFDLDMEILNKISSMTNGQAFLASDAEALETIYDEIDELEPTTFKTTQHTLYSEKSGDFMFVAVIILFLGLVLGMTVLRRLP
jgi:Ca-activated chloride channel family protein